jgi:hypothetical protein
MIAEMIVLNVDLTVTAVSCEVEFQFFLLFFVEHVYQFWAMFV